MATQQRRYGTLDLTTANGIQVETWNDTPLFDTGFESRTDGQGSLRTADKCDGRAVSMQGEITGSGDRDIVRGNLDTFLAAFRNRQDYLTLFDDRRLLCGLSEEVDYSYTKGTELARIRWSLKLRSQFPTWESTTVSSVSLSITAGTDVTGAMAANIGAAAAYPQIVLTNNGSSFSGMQVVLTNLSTGAQFSLDGLSLAAGQDITVDMLWRRIGDGISIPAMISGYSGDWWGISPVTTQQLSVHTSASCSLTIVPSFRARYWSA